MIFKSTEPFDTPHSLVARVVLKNEGCGTAYVILP
jgi:hypothetical protein